MKEEKLQLILTVVRYSLALIGVGLCILLFSGPNVADGMGKMKEFRESSKMIGVDYTVFILGLAIFSVVGFFVYQLVMQPKKTVSAIIGIVAATLVFFVIFLVGSSDTNESLHLRHAVSDQVITTATAGIYTILICIGAGVLSVLVGPVLGRYRK